MRPTWMKEILRENEGGGGSGAGVYIDEGASGDAPAPAAEDRTSKLEQRFERLAQSVEGFMGNQKQREQQSQAAQTEAKIRQAEAQAEREVADAETALANAYDDGDGVTIAKAQRILSEKAAQKERVKFQAQDVRAQMKAGEHRDGGTRSEGAEEPVDTTNLEGWKKKHASWYGVDKEMTKAAHEVDAQIRANKVIEPGTQQYFEAIDRQMAQRYPDQFRGTPPSGGTGHAVTTGGQRQVRIPQSVADGFRRMGINVDDPETAKRMVKHREKAVAKGWLPETPPTNLRVRQR